MIKVRYDSNNSELERAYSPCENSIFYADSKSYYLGRGNYDSKYIKEGLKPGLSYWVSFEIIINGNIMSIFDDEVYFLSFDENFIIQDQIKATPSMLILPSKYNLKNTILFQLFISLDYDSIKGRKVLLENIIPEFDSEKRLPENFNIPTKIIDLSFCFREEESYSEKEYVPISKITGTTHSSYEGLSWYNIFMRLKRINNIYKAFTNPIYYSQLEEGIIIPENMSFYKIDDDYYISSGTHRVTIAILKGIEGIYAPVTHLKVSKFHKSAFEKIKKFGFNVELCGDDQTYYDIIANVGSREIWEVFKVSIGDKSILLLNKKMINEFILMYEKLNTTKFSIIFREMYRKFKRFFDMLSENRKFNSDDLFYKKFVEDAVFNFYINNNLEVSNLKNNYR